jgi:hypothetical protein
MALSGSDTTNNAAVRSPKQVEYVVNKVTRALHLLELVRSRDSTVDDGEAEPDSTASVPPSWVAMGVRR